MALYGAMANSRSTRRLAVILSTSLGALFLGFADAAVAASTSSRLAYVDPGAGSFILQAAVAMFAGAVVAINAYWARIKRFLGLGADDGNGDEKPAARSDDG